MTETTVELVTLLSQSDTRKSQKNPRNVAKLNGEIQTWGFFFFRKGDRIVAVAVSIAQKVLCNVLPHHLEEACTFFTFVIPLCFTKKTPTV